MGICCVTKTLDGGVTWMEESFEDTYDLQRIKFTSDSVGYIVAKVGWDYKLFKTWPGVGIEKPDEHRELIKLYPNPVSSELNLSPIQQGIQVKNLEIISLSGKTIQKIPEFTSPVSVAHLTPGLYILKYTMEGKTYYQKFSVIKSLY